jgi:hypothetical protein
MFMFKRGYAPAPLGLATLVVTATVIGLAAGSALAKAPPGDCGWQSLSEPLSSLGDSNTYFLMAGSSFEADLADWSLDGAVVASGNETYFASGPGDHSLGVAAGASATSPAVCVTIESPTLRFFLRNTGAKDAKLRVSLNFVDKDGKPRTQKLKDIGADSVGAWELTDPLKFLGPINSILDKNGKATVSFEFEPKDDKGNWQIDDIFVDPMKSQ